jgi:hypothetical protein
LEEEEREKAKLRQQEKEHAEQQELERQKQLEQQRRDENERLVATSLPPVIPSAPPAEDNNSGIPPDLTTTSETYPMLSDGTSHIETAEVERCACI